MTPPDNAEARSLAHHLLGLGATRGAAQVLRNAQLQAAKLRDLPQRPASGRRVEPQPHAHPANDHCPVSMGGNIA